MKNALFPILLLTLFGCAAATPPDAATYFELVRAAELRICADEFAAAVLLYEQAFERIDKPFGKDVYNAALASQLAGRAAERDRYLQQLIDNSEDWTFVKSKFVDRFLSEEAWQQLVDRRQVDYDPILRRESEAIFARDQRFRPDYDTYDDTINASRQLNLARILFLTDSLGLPAQMELGYTANLRGQRYHIVLHHTAQRRSYEKSVLDLEPLLRTAVAAGRFDPEMAIYYLHFQDDPEKGRFEVYSTWQYQHPLLADSLNSAVWLPRLDAAQKQAANAQRAAWHASSLEEIATKAAFLSRSGMPFLFTSVRKSVANLSDALDAASAREQYQMFTQQMEVYR